MHHLDLAVVLAEPRHRDLLDLCERGHLTAYLPNEDNRFSLTPGGPAGQTRTHRLSGPSEAS